MIKISRGRRRGSYMVWEVERGETEVDERELEEQAEVKR